MKKVLLCLFLINPCLLSAQKLTPTKNDGGFLQLGMRSTISAFGSNGYIGTGVGGQLRLKLANKLNTEWFTDYITTDIGGLGNRVDAHIGWSVMFYPFKDYNEAKFTPYILAGHCFDFTKISTNSNPEINLLKNNLSRWSSAVQLGAGTHFHISPKADVSLAAQYMTHLGNDIHTEKAGINGESFLRIKEDNQKNLSLEGHLLFTVSLNIAITDLW